MSAGGRTAARCTWTPETHRGCGWTYDDPGADRAAEKHTRATGHGTCVESRPASQTHDRPLDERAAGEREPRLTREPEGGDAA